MTDYICPRCQEPYTNFKALCSHVQHDHGLWYLAKQRYSTNDVSRVKKFDFSPTAVPVNCQACRDNLIELNKLKQNLQIQVRDLKLQNENLFMEVKSLKSLSIISDDRSQTDRSIREQLISSQAMQNPQKSSGKDLDTNVIVDSQPFNSSEVINDLKNSVRSEVNFLNESYRGLQREMQLLRMSVCEAEKENGQKADSNRPVLQKTSSLSSQGGSTLADSGKGGSVAHTEEFCPVNDLPATPTSSPLKLCTTQRNSQSSSRDCSASSQGSGQRKSFITLPKTSLNTVNSSIPEGEEEERQLDAVFRLVFRYLSTDSLLTCRHVCHQWRLILRDPLYWTSVTLIHRVVTPNLLQALATLCRKMKFLTMQGLKCYDASTALNRNNDEVDNSSGCLESGLESLLRSSHQSLQSVSIIDCSVLMTERCLWLLGCHSPHLRQLAYISDAHPATAEALWSLGAGCRKLHTLIVPPLQPSLHPKRFNNRCLFMVGRCWSGIRTLCIGGTEITAAGLIDLVVRCQQLEALELDHMGEIHESVAARLSEEGLQKLKQLYLTRTPITPKAIQCLKGACSKLEKISILISAEDYFLHPESKSNREKFAKKLQALKILKKDRDLRQILVIDVATCN